MQAGRYLDDCESPSKSVRRRRRRRRRRHCHERCHERRRQVHRRMRQHKRRHRRDQHKRCPHLLPRRAAVRRPRPHRPSPQLGLVPTAHPRPRRPIRVERGADETTVGFESIQSSSEIIRGYQRSSHDESLWGSSAPEPGQRSSAVLKGVHQRQSHLRDREHPEFIRDHQRLSEVITEAITPAGLRASRADRSWAR